MQKQTPIYAALCLAICAMLSLPTVEAAQQTADIGSQTFTQQPTPEIRRVLLRLKNAGILLDRVVLNLKVGDACQPNQLPKDAVVLNLQNRPVSVACQNGKLVASANQSMQKIGEKPER